MDEQKLDELLTSESEHINKLNTIVLEAIEEEKLLSQKIYESEQERYSSFSSRLADRIAHFGGSWTFIIAFMAIMLAWIITNTILLDKPVDAYPFILLNLLLSTLAAIQAPIIIMSQNRKEERDRQRAINDYLVNLKAEIEIRNMHQKLDLLIAEQMKTLFELQVAQVEMMKDIKTAIK